jgi:uncharacterized protein YkwD
MKALTFILILFVTSSFSQTPDSQIGNDSLNTKLLDELIIKEINNERIKARSKVLTYNKSIADRAHKHVEWMILEDTFAHSHTGSEIIEINYFSDKVTYSDLAKDIIKVWMNSPGHRDILLSSGPNANIGVHAGVFSKEDTSKKYLYRDKNTPSTVYKIKATANFYF